MISMDFFGFSAMGSYGLVARLRLWRWTKAKDPDPRCGALLGGAGGGGDGPLRPLTGF